MPRPAAELTADGSVHTVDGHDVTAEYRAGAETAVALAKANDVVGAVMKARSPSCGSAQVYDGTFTRKLVPGQGLAVAALRAAGFEVASEEDVSDGWLPTGDI